MMLSPVVGAQWGCEGGRAGTGGVRMREAKGGGAWVGGGGAVGAPVSRLHPRAALGDRTCEEAGPAPLGLPSPHGACGTAPLHPCTLGSQPRAGRRGVEGQPCRSVQPRNALRPFFRH